jgi:hypothetical protein
VADRETVAATLAAAMLSNTSIVINEESAAKAVEAYHLVLAELTKADAEAHRDQFR